MEELHKVGRGKEEQVLRCRGEDIGAGRGLQAGGRAWNKRPVAGADIVCPLATAESRYFTHTSYVTGSLAGAEVLP